jgi:Cyclopropane fatty acid synthase and related methyltransferases
MKVCSIFILTLTSNIVLSSAFSRTGLASPPKHIWPQLVVGGQEDPALAHIENNQRQLGRPYGDFLDAGTGIYSLRWIAGLLYRYSDPRSPLAFRSYVAVTADANFQRDVQAKAKELGIQEWGEVRLGNWAVGYHGIQGEELCQDEMFDTILADYLVGAVDYFAPFYQDLLLEKLARLLRPGGVVSVNNRKIDISLRLAIEKKTMSIEL